MNPKKKSLVCVWTSCLVVVSDMNRLNQAVGVSLRVEGNSLGFYRNKTFRSSLMKCIMGILYLL